MPGHIPEAVLCYTSKYVLSLFLIDGASISTEQMKPAGSQTQKVNFQNKRQKRNCLTAWCTYPWKKHRQQEKRTESSKSEQETIIRRAKCATAETSLKGCWWGLQTRGGRISTVAETCRAEWNQPVTDKKNFKKRRLKMLQQAQVWQRLVRE